MNTAFQPAAAETDSSASELDPDAGRARRPQADGERDLQRVIASLRDELARRDETCSRLGNAAAALEQAQRLGQIGSWSWDVQRDETAWSIEMFRMFGIDPCARAPTLAERAMIYSPAAYERLCRAVARAKETGEGFVLELDFRRDDGSWGWVEARGEALRDASGAVSCLRGTAQDVTARRTAEDALRQSRAFLERTNTLAGVGGWELELATRTLKWSAQMCRLHGLEVTESIGVDDALALCEPGSRARIERAVARAAASGQGFDMEVQIVRRDGVRRWLRTVGSPERDGDCIARIVGATQDVTDRRRLLERLAEQHELLRITLESIADAVITTDASERVTWLNPVAERMTGWRAAEALGRRIGEVFRLVDETTRRPLGWPLAEAAGRTRGSHADPHRVLLSRDGGEFGVEQSASPIRNEAGEPLGMVLVFHDVTEQRRVGREMRWRATHDALTGLVNRGELETRLQRLLDRSPGDRGGHALLYIDLDQFKPVNDACGHAAGDLLLQQVARLLQDGVRTRDTVARLGGDEFAVLMEHCAAEDAAQVAEKLCERMDEFRFVHEQRRFRIGASVGLVPVDDRWADMSALLQAADSCCYAAKEGGRNRVHAWFDTDAAMRVRHGDMQWVARLEQALDEQRFTLHAQRIHPVATGTCGLHAEVLLRLVEQDGTLVPPGAFLPAAERFGLAPRIDRWVLRQVIAMLQAASLDDVRTLAVNLSGQSVADPSFQRQAADLLEAAGPEICRRLCLEITETSIIARLADAAAFVRGMRALGCRIAIDDFGSGASSFGYLKKLEVDMLKIDGQFIQGVVDDRLDEAAVQSFIQVARAVGVVTVAEFVDRPPILERLRWLGIDHVQGFLMHRPEPIASVLGAR